MPSYIVEKPDRTRTGRTFRIERRMTEAQRQAFAKLRGRGVFERMRKLRLEQALPETVSGDVAHTREYIAAVMDLAILSEGSTREFAKLFIDRSPAFSNSDTGMAAVMFESYLVEHEVDLFKRLVETQIDGRKPTFLALFEGKIAPQEMDRLQQGADFVKIAVVLEAGRVAYGEGIVADVTVLECAPTKRPKPTGVKPPAETGPREGLHPRTRKDYEKVVQEGGVSEGVFRYLYGDKVTETRTEANQQAVLDQNNVMWVRKTTGYWIPKPETLQESDTESLSEGGWKRPASKKEQASKWNSEFMDGLPPEIAKNSKNWIDAATYFRLMGLTPQEALKKFLQKTESITEVLVQKTKKLKARGMDADEAMQYWIQKGEDADAIGDAIVQVYGNADKKKRKGQEDLFWSTNLGRHVTIPEGHYQQRNGTVESTFRSWRVDRTDEGCRVSFKEGAYDIRESLEEVKELLERMREVYEDLPDEFDVMAEAFLKEYAAENGTRASHKDDESLAEQQEAEAEIRDTLVAGRDFRVTRKNHLRLRAAGLAAESTRSTPVSEVQVQRNGPGYVAHKITLQMLGLSGKGHYSAWYDADKKLTDAEQILGSASRPVKRDGPVWRALQQRAGSILAALKEDLDEGVHQIVGKDPVKNRIVATIQALIQKRPVTVKEIAKEADASEKDVEALLDPLEFEGILRVKSGKVYSPYAYYREGADVHVPLKDLVEAGELKEDFGDVTLYVNVFDVFNPDSLPKQGVKDAIDAVQDAFYLEVWPQAKKKLYAALRKNPTVLKHKWTLKEGVEVTGADVMGLSKWVADMKAAAEAGNEKMVAAIKNNIDKRLKELKLPRKKGYELLGMVESDTVSLSEAKEQADVGGTLKLKGKKALKLPDGLSVAWSPVNQAWMVLFGSGSIPSRTVLRVVGDADELHDYLRLDLKAKVESVDEGRDNPGVRDGTGPFKGSWQRKNKGKGRRKLAGEPCPYEEIEEALTGKEKEAVKQAQANAKQFGIAYVVRNTSMGVKVERLRKGEDPTGEQSWAGFSNIAVVYPDGKVKLLKESVTEGKWSKTADTPKGKGTLIGTWEDLAAYYDAGGTAWKLQNGKWTNMGETDAFKKQLAAGRWRGKLIESDTESLDEAKKSVVIAKIKELAADAVRVRKGGNIQKAQQLEREVEKLIATAERGGYGEEAEDAEMEAQQDAQYESVAEGFKKGDKVRAKEDPEDTAVVLDPKAGEANIGGKKHAYMTVARPDGKRLKVKPEFWELDEGRFVAPKPPSEDVYGFWGTIQSNSGQDDGSYTVKKAEADKLWKLAAEEIAKKTGESDPQVVSNFLRSTYGRHFADEAANQAPDVTVKGFEQGVKKAVANWSWWKKGFAKVKDATKKGEWQESDEGTDDLEVLVELRAAGCSAKRGMRPTSKKRRTRPEDVDEASRQRGAEQEAVKILGGAEKAKEIANRVADDMSDDDVYDLLRSKTTGLKQARQVAAYLMKHADYGGDERVLRALNKLVGKFESEEESLEELEAAAKKGNIQALISYWKRKLKDEEHPFEMLVKWADKHPDEITGDAKAWAAWMHNQVYGMWPATRAAKKREGKTVKPLAASVEEARLNEEEWADKFSKTIRVSGEEFDRLASEMAEFDDIASGLGAKMKAAAKPKTVVPVTDGGRVIVVDPQGYDYARYKTPVMHVNVFKTLTPQQAADAFVRKENVDPFRNWKPGDNPKSFIVYEEAGSAQRPFDEGQDHASKAKTATAELKLGKNTPPLKAEVVLQYDKAKVTEKKPSAGSSFKTMYTYTMPVTLTLSSDFHGVTKKQYTVTGSTVLDNSVQPPRFGWDMEMRFRDVKPSDPLSRNLLSDVLSAAGVYKLVPGIAVESVEWTEEEVASLFDLNEGDPVKALADKIRKTPDYKLGIGRATALYLARGDYKADEAHKMAVHLVQQMAKKHYGENYFDVYTPEVRERVQKKLAAYAREDAPKLNHLLPKKYQKGFDGYEGTDESVSRYCGFWKDSKGQWWMDLADREHGEEREATTYGPFASLDAAEEYRKDNFSNPGGATSDPSGKRKPPTKSPNGRPVEKPQRSRGY